MVNIILFLYFFFSVVIKHHRSIDLKIYIYYFTFDTVLNVYNIKLTRISIKFK